MPSSIPAPQPGKNRLINRYTNKVVFFGMKFILFFVTILSVLFVYM